MPEILICSSEGEWSVFDNVLNSRGDDDKRRGSVQLNIGDQMFKDFGSTDDCWVHARMASEGLGNASSQTDILHVRDSSGTVIAGISKSGATLSFPRVQFIYRENGTLTTNSEQFPEGDEVFANYDIHWKVVGGVATVKFYRNEVLRFQKTLSGASNPASQILMAFGSNSDTGDRVWVQDTIVTDGIPTVGMELATLVPNAVGNYSTFDNDYTNIAELGYDSSTVIISDATGEKESWTYATPAFDLSDKLIYAVVASTVAQADLVGVVSDFTPFLRIASVDYDNTDLGVSTFEPLNIPTVWTLNPATSQRWLEADLASLESGLTSK